MTPEEFNQKAQAKWNSPRGSLDVMALVEALTDDEFQAVHQSPQPIGQDLELSRYLAFCFRTDAVRRATKPQKTIWERL